MRGYVLVAEALGEREGDSFYQPAGVDEDQRRAMVLRVGGELVEDLFPHGGGGDGAELVAGHFDGEVEFAALADLNDVAGLREAWTPVRKLATSSIGFCVAERPIRCGGVDRPVRNAPGESRFSPQTRASRRSSESARCAPRLSSATAWISSTMTVWTRRRCSRDLPAVSRM